MKIDEMAATAEDGVRRSQLMYAAASLMTTACLATAFAAIAGHRESRFSTALLLICSVPVAGHYAALGLRKIVQRTSRPRILPRLEKQDALSAQAVVLLVVPALLSSQPCIGALLHKLAELGDEHPETNFRFALLTDFDDAPFATMPEDATLLAAARLGIELLNEQAPVGRRNRFFLLHRQRVWSKGERTWMGWERKRGKLLQLCQLLTNRSELSPLQFVAGLRDDLLITHMVPYVISIDEQSAIDRSSTWALICTAAHPANRPVIDSATNRLQSGFGIIQPNLRILSHHITERSAHLRPGVVQPSGNAPAGRLFPFDAFGVGVYKAWAALFDVSACSRLLSNVFPDDTVLHHDLLEGFVAGTGETYAAQVAQHRSPTYFGRLARGHRWLRGTFQSIPWIAPSIRNQQRALIDNPIPIIGRIYIAELTLIELQKPGSVILIVFALLGPHISLLWLLIVYPPVIEWMANSVRAAWRFFRGRRSRFALRALRSQLGYDAFGVAFGLAVLALEAAVVLDAFGRAFWRMVISRQRRLEWKTHTRSNVDASRNQAQYWKAFWPASAFSLGLLASVAVFAPSNFWIAAPLAIVWAASPMLLWIADDRIFDPV